MSASVALPRGLEVIADEEWEELDFGDWDGAALEALPMDALSAFHLDPHANPPPHGESWGHFERRLARLVVKPRTCATTHESVRRGGFTEAPGEVERGVACGGLKRRKMRRR
jgi:hypothetical protein